MSEEAAPIMSPVAESPKAQERQVLPIVANGATFFGTEGQQLLDHVDLTIAGSGILIVMGPNGAGKSLLLRVLTGLVPINDGSISWAGKPALGNAVRRIGFVFQKPVMFRRSVLENVTFVLRQAGLSKDESGDRAADALTDADLMHLADAPARRLSGGEQQRVAIARARAIDPEILFLDEPTAHLDPASTAIIEKMILDAKSRGTHIVHVTHDLGQAKRLADDIIFLHQGKLVEHGRAEAFFAGPKSKAAQAFVAGDLVI